MPAHDTPAAEVHIDEALVRALLTEQAPDLAALPLRFLAAGWDNELYRLGDRHVVRLPRRELGADLVEHEQTWLPRLAPRLPLPIPVPVVDGRPTPAYPWRWSVCPWIDGEPGSLARPTDDVGAAASLGRFLAALHTDAPADAPHNPYRGMPLVERDDHTRNLIDRVADVIGDPGAVLAAWEAALAVPVWHGPPSWVHGDLHPGNVLVHDGRLAAVIDFGDLCGGDPATDLAIAWAWFGPEARGAFRRSCGADDATWDRGRGWAVTHSLSVLGSSADRPEYMAFGLHALREAVAELRETSVTSYTRRLRI